MGTVGGNLSKVGVQITDSPYVVLSQHVMARVSTKVFDIIEENGGGEYVKCFHSVGCPIIDGKTELELVNNWPCNPEKVIVSHIPERREIISYGSGYGGNSLLGKKCFALHAGFEKTSVKYVKWPKTILQHYFFSILTPSQPKFPFRTKLLFSLFVEKEFKTILYESVRHSLKKKVGSLNTC